MLVLGSFEKAFCIVKLINGSMDLTQRSVQLIQVIMVCRWVIKSFGQILEDFTHFPSRVTEGFQEQVGQ